MTVTFHPTLLENLRPIGSAWKRGAGRFWWFVPFLVVVSLIVAIPLIGRPKQMMIVIVGLWLMLGVALVLAVLLLLMLSWIVTGRNPFKSTTVTVDDSGVQLGSDGCGLVVGWDEFRSIETTKSYVLLRFLEYGCLMIPRRAFADEDAWRAFSAFCERLAAR